MFVLLYMLFAKFFPIMAISAIKEAALPHHRTGRSGGRRWSRFAQVEGNEEAHA